MRYFLHEVRRVQLHGVCFWRSLDFLYEIRCVQVASQILKLRYWISLDQGQSCHDLSFSDGICFSIVMAESMRGYSNVCPIQQATKYSMLHLIQRGCIFVGRHGLFYPRSGLSCHVSFSVSHSDIIQISCMWYCKLDQIVLIWYH